MDHSEKKLHVAMVILEYFPLVGGAQRQIQQLLPFLIAAGLKVSVLTRHRPNLPLSEKLDGATVIRIPAPGSKARASLSYTWGCLRWLSQNRPDIVHAYSFLSPLTIGVIAKRLWRIPLLVKVLRGGQLGDPQRLLRRRFAGQRLIQYRQHVDLFIEISNEIHTELESLHIPANLRRFLPNGVDTERFVPAINKEGLRIKLGLPRNELLVVYTGRLASEKRLDQLVTLWPTLPSPCHLILLGDGPEREALEAKAAQGIHFLGRQADVLPYLQAADIFVLPSAAEGLSNALLEAMSVGLAVVSTAIGGAPDVIENGVSGQLVAPDEPDQLRQALGELLENKVLREKLGKRARKTMVEHYSLPKIAATYLELYRLMAQNSATNPL